MPRTRMRTAPPSDDGMPPAGSTESELRSAAAQAEPDAFVSYAREDDDVAHALGEGLRAAGRSVWIDRDKIPYAADWRTRARAGIDASKAVVLVLSPDWLASDACRYELEHAVASAKRLVPVMVGSELEPTDLPPALRDLVWIPVAGRDGAAATAAVLATLDDDLAWRDMHARLLVRALEWESKSRDRSLLLRGADLRDAERWLTAPGRHGETATPAHSAYIVAGRREAARRQRIALALVAAALVVSLGLAAVALWQRDVADRRRQEADAQRRVAVENARQARSRELAATGTAQLADDPELALLLGVEAAKHWPTAQAEELLRAALPRVSGTTTLRHPALQAIATDDGDRIAVTGGRDGLARTWDLTSGRRLAVLRGHSALGQTDVAQGVLAVAVAPGGELAATGGAEGDVRVWEPRSGRLRYVLHAPAGPASDFGVHVGFAGDGTLVTAGASGVVRTWAAATGRPRAAAALPDFEITELAISPDGRRIAAIGLPSLDGDGVLATWDAATLESLARVRTTAYEVSMDRHGDRVVTSAQGAAQVWDARTGRLQRTFAGAASIPAAAFAPDGRTLAVAHQDGRVELRDVVTGASRAVLHHGGTISAIAFDRDGRRLLTSGTDKTARLWELGTGKLLETLRGHRSPVWHAQFVGDGTRVLTAGGDGAARIWRAAQGRPSRELRAHDAVVDDIALSPDGRIVVTASEDGTTRLWDARSGARIARLRHGVGDPSLAMSSDGHRLAVSTFAAPSLVSLPTGRPLDTLPGRRDAQAAFTPDGSLLVASSGVVWDVAARRRVGTIPASIGRPVLGRRGSIPVVFEVGGDGHAVLAALPSGRVLTRLRGRFKSTSVPAALSPDGSLLAAEAGATTALWDARSGRRLGALGGEQALPPGQAFDAGGDRLLTIAQAGVRVWDARRRQLIADLPHPRPVGSAAFSPDDRLILTASYDGLARIWEARTGRLVTTFRGRSTQTWNEGFVPHALFGPDDRLVVSATGGDTAFVADCEICAPLRGLLAQAAQATSRTLTADERRTFLGR